MRKCQQCKQRFEPRANTLQPTCSPECAYAWIKSAPDRAEHHRKRAAALERREYRQKVETPSQAAAKAQRVFNEWIRLRDAGRPCVSCGHPNDGTRKWNAGHYRPAGSNPALRFNERNVHGQCERCNSYQSGNLPAYREELIRRIGWEEVFYLDGPHDLPHRTVGDFRAIEREYRARVKAMKVGAA